MPTLTLIRDEIGPDCRKVLSHIWSIFLETGEWPSSRRIHSELGKDFVSAALSKTNGSVVFESLNNGSKQYHLVGVAPLLTNDAAVYQSLLTRYLELLRLIYRQAPEKRSLSNNEVEQALSLSARDSQTLCRLISITQLFSNSSSCGKEGWNVGILDESEDFPDGSLEQVLEELVLRSYNPIYPILYEDQISKLSGYSSDLAPPAMDSRSKAPIVFISYSHDSAEHKRWVEDLARTLHSKGIEVLLDEWHVKPGGDVTHFMEQSIARADRVLLICTEKYVQKVDNRKGGAGYEAVVSIAELVKDLTTTKFVPVVRQKRSTKQIPRCLGVRYYINLSHGSSYKKELEKLIDSLRGTPR
jgi:hypothetical protein